MGAPSPELCNLWLARAFNAQDVDAAAAMYHPEASIVQVDEVHGGTTIARGSEGIRKTMAAYIGLKPHMDVITHHTTVAGDFAMTRSQWLIRGTDKDGQPIQVHHHGRKFTGNCPMAPGCSSWTTHSAPTRVGRSKPRLILSSTLFVA
jgi:ketosteroid isomerase-like protein